jgi:hypothetical protein
MDSATRAKGTGKRADASLCRIQKPMATWREGFPDRKMAGSTLYIQENLYTVVHKKEELGWHGRTFHARS